MPTWFGTNTLVSNFQEMSETSPGADATSSPIVGWVVGTGSTNSAHMDAGTTGDGFRTTSTYTGNFAAAAWTFNFVVVGVTQAATADGRVVYRLFRGANADGSGATQITSAQQQASVVTDLTTTAQTSTHSLSPGAITVTNEYLFVQVAWLRTGAGGHTTTDVIFRWGNTGTRVISAAFTPTATPGIVFPRETWQKVLIRR
jgi:hypothetical protein